ncbi:hypothetical protein BDV96DRAFT_640083 [Lophiotrema nucula]|uniref:Metalloendopeptidase n=1 Tax=Lophiotrema nucula TaxID=690887 RepID=A0A6A5ZRY9_9PLEO|nr:hypothetical protein BDV96DRAFT_640083 [Lophiotrema nucula]
MRLTISVLVALVTIPFVLAISPNPNYEYHLPNLYDVSSSDPSNDRSSDPSDPSSDPLSGPQSGWADHLQAQLAQPWPLKNNRHRIKYCYANKATKDALECRMQDAMTLWQNALGGPPSAMARYSLFFKATKDKDHKDLFCYPDFQDMDHKGTWNTAIKEDVLAVFTSSQEGISHATVGFRPGQAMEMVVDHGAEAAVVAHELGHVMGMIHEQSRSDRDTYIKFYCENIKGYQEALNAIKQDPDALAQLAKNNPPVADDKKEEWFINKICNTMFWSRKYEFLAYAYLKGDGMVGIPVDGDWGFDFDSIMLYSSFQTAASSLCDYMKDFCVMLRKTTVNGQETLSTFDSKSKPSLRDAQFVRKWYPWVGEQVPKTSQKRWD